MQQQLHLRDIFFILRKYRWTLIIVFLIVFSGTLLVTFTATPQYEATTKLVIDRSEPSQLTGAPIIQRDPEFFETQYQLLKSGAVARRVADRLTRTEGEKVERLYRREEESESAPLAWIKLLLHLAELEKTEKKEPAQPQPEEYEWLVQAIRKGIRVVPVEGSRIVLISFQSPDPRFAALVANEAVDGYVAEINKMKSENSRQFLEWMNRKAEGEEKQLKEAEQGLQEYLGTNDILTLENRIAVIPEKLSRISTELVGAETRRKQMEELVAKIGRGADDPEAAESVAAILSDQALQSLRSQIVATEKNILELSGKYGPKHPVMQKAEGDLGILKRKKNQEIARITRSIRNEYELALANERNLRAQLEQTKEEALRTNEKFVKFQSLKAGVDTNRKLFDALMLKMKEEGITGESQSVKLWVVEKAGVPAQPATPRKAINLTLGLLVGLFGGIGLAFFREYLDNTIRNPDDAEAAFQTPVLGNVSLLRGREPIERIVQEEPLAAVTESYKSLRTALLASGKMPRRFLVTSSLPGEGKTSTATNLALALAQSEHRVLLIDADLRKPRIHDVFALGNREGLSRLLSAPIEGGVAWNFLQPGPVANLSVLTSGPIPPNPSELLMSNAMRELLHRLQEKFDIIICDSPPVLAVEDSRILSRLFHGTLVVVKAHQTTFEVAGRALKLLRRVKAPVLGFVVNGLDQRKSESYYHSRYYTTYETGTRQIRG